MPDQHKRDAPKLLFKDCHGASDLAIVGLILKIKHAIISIKRHDRIGAKNLAICAYVIDRHGFVEWCDLGDYLRCQAGGCDHLDPFGHLAGAMGAKMPCLTHRAQNTQCLFGIFGYPN